MPAPRPASSPPMRSKTSTHHPALRKSSATNRPPMEPPTTIARGAPPPGRETCAMSFRLFLGMPTSYYLSFDKLKEVPCLRQVIYRMINLHSRESGDSSSCKCAEE